MGWRLVTRLKRKLLTLKFFDVTMRSAMFCSESRSAFVARPSRASSIDMSVSRGLYIGMERSLLYE